MPETPSDEKITTDSDFLLFIESRGIRNLERCYQCQTCSNSCPVAYAMDYFPHQLIHMIALGIKDNALKSKTIWICVSCGACAARCPNDVDIVQLMDVLRQLVLQEKVKVAANQIPEFHKAFVKEIRKRGRIHELGLLFPYKLKTSDFSAFGQLREDSKLALNLILRGKLKLFPKKFKGKKEVNEIFSKISSSNL